jgi:acetyl-CoA acetyltransferase
MSAIVAGVGMTAFGKYPDRRLGDLAAEAVRDALCDARLQSKDIGMVFYANAAAGLLSGQEMIRGEVTLREAGLQGIPIVNVENACASGSSAIYMASMAIESGQCDVALAVGTEKLSHPDKRRTFDALASAIDVERSEEVARGLLRSGDGGAPERSLFMDIYVDIALRYMARSGATEADFGNVSVKNHAHGALNPKAQYRAPVTLEEVLDSRRISGPLTLLMCSPIGDGAAAVVVCSERKARELGVEAIFLRGIGLASGREGDDASPVERAAALAYERAGIGPEDLDVVELHDAAAPAELIIYEELALCASGAGPALLRSRDTWLGGRVPVNPSGGLLSKGHPVGATGCAQVVELVEQLRGHCGDRQVARARVALAENAGGYVAPHPAVATVTVLSR